MQDLVQSYSADLVTMPPQLLDHGEAVDRLLRGMMESVQPDQARKEILVVN